MPVKVGSISNILLIKVIQTWFFIEDVFRLLSKRLLPSWNGAAKRVSFFVTLDIRMLKENKGLRS